MKAFYLFLAMAYIAVGCKEDEPADNPDTKTWVSFIETQCANPPFVEKDPEITKRNILRYLLDNDINVWDLSYERQKPMITCQACTCPDMRGYIYNVKIDTVNRQKAFKLRFR